MKRISASVLALALLSQAHAQNKPHYPISGGLLAAGSFSTFKKTEGPSTVEYASKLGYQIGGFLNFPLGRSFSIDFQPQYSNNRYAPKDGLSGIPDGRLSSIALPLLLKIHAGRNFAFTLGPQLDLRTGFSDENNNYDKDDFASSFWSISGGLEVFPHGRVTPYARYIHGLTTHFQTGSPSSGLSDYSNRNIQVGLKFRLFGQPTTAVAAAATAAVVASPPPPPPPADTDGDGITDPNDKCPTVAGTAKYNGCPVPDTDGDGINDENDKCPTVAGTAKYNGCPVPDTDGDGLNDENDKCPTEAGAEKYNGCPVPDTDGDGLNDEDDYCPNTPGVAENKGCPEMILYYKRDVSELDATDKANLDRVAQFLYQHPNVNVVIEGHTSTLGADAYNMTLSQKRADLAKTYLAKKGIDAARMRTIAFGEKYPIGDNTKEEGRAASRRVVIRIDNKQ